MQVAVTSTTQADQVHRFLRDEILSCRVPPGAKIKINEVAAQLEVSLGAVREALARLAAEGMAVATAQKGYTAPSISVDELTDLTRTRIEIEKLCLRAVIQNGDVEWETNVVGAFHRLHRIPEREPTDPSRLNEAWAGAHTVFHSALVAGSGSAWLGRIRDQLYAQSERYRRLSVPLRDVERDVDGEHRSIMEATLAHDADLACRLMEEHLWRTAEILLLSPVVLGKPGGLMLLAG